MHVSTKHVYAWSLMYFLNYFVFNFLEGCPCEKNACGLSVDTCGLSEIYYFSFALTLGSFAYIWIIAATKDEDNKLVQNLFDMSIAAAPLNVGFAWNSFMVAWIQKTRDEWPKAKQYAVLMVVFVLFV